MKNEFTLAFNEVLEEKQLPRDVILRALESAMVSAYRRAVNASNAQHVEAKIEPDTGKVVISAEKEVVEAVQDQRTEVSLAEARKVDPEVEIGGMVIVETTPHDFGRVAAQTARQVIQQRIREAEREAQQAYFEKQVGEIVSGVVQAINGQGVTIGMDMKAEGVMMRKEMIPGERFRVHDRVRSLVMEVKDGPRGPQILLSRAHRNFLRRLLENEVPEIYHGVVEIRSIAREPGERAKVAVAATQQGIDPVGACVGIRGVRIQAIVRELHEEKIDVIEWNADPAAYIAKAISPARTSGVYLNDRVAGGKTATVVVPEDALSLAIGRDGQNARLAAKLTGWRIDIKSLPEAVGETLEKLKADEALAEASPNEVATIPNIEALLVKKAEGRPLAPEEFEQMVRFMDRVEKRIAARRVPEKKAEEPVAVEVPAGVPEGSFQIAILDSGISDHVAAILKEANYATLGDVLVRMKTNPDAILALRGIGPRAMAEIENVSNSYLASFESARIGAAETAAPEAEVTGQPVDGLEPVAVEVAAVEAGETIPAATSVEEEEEGTAPSFEELFTMKPDVLQTGEVTDEDEGDDKKGGKKGKKKKGRHVEIEYDPDRDITITRKKHKRGDEGWGDI